MLGYYVELALRSLRRTPGLTLLMILAIAVGVGTSMTTLAIFRTAAGDPIPGRSTSLFTPQIDNCGPRCSFFQDHPPADRMPLLLTYRDAVALLSLPAQNARAAMYATGLTAVPADPQSFPLQVATRATGADFFPLFQVPFEYGAPWSRHDDAAHAAVVVISAALNDQLFDGSNSVGRSLRLGSVDYRVVGVTERWQPVPRFYDLFPGTLGDVDAAFIPFSNAVDLRLQPTGAVSCGKTRATQRRRSAQDRWAALIGSECNWVQFWAYLPDSADVQHYRQLLTAYADEQRRDGRFQWPARVQLRNVTQWLRYMDVVPGEVRMALIVALALLAACLANAMGLILARFLPRALDVSVRRATGATRPMIFVQSLVEVGLVGVIGGGLGLLLTLLGLEFSRKLLPLSLVELVRFDGVDAGLAFALAIAASLAAGLYPVWRMSRIQPAFQLKVQ